MLELFLFIFGYSAIDYDLCTISQEIPELEIICEIPREEFEFLQEIENLDNLD